MSAMRSSLGGVVSVPVMGLHFMSRPRYTAKSYVRDGLVAMWDGIENAGWGVHDPNATTWVDLTEHGHDAIFDMGHSGDTVNLDGYFSSNAYVFPSNSVSTASFVANLGNVLTLQFCYSDFDKNSTYYALYDTYDDSVNFYNYGGKWSQNIYGVRTDIFLGNEDFLPRNGVVSHYFSDIVGGIQVNTDAPKEVSASSGIPAEKRWCIGGPYSSNYFSGNMHNVRIYNRALTVEENAHNYAVDKERFNLS